MREWIDWYDSNHTIYANARHKDVHFRRIAEDIATYVPARDSIVLDYGCGEALRADIVADKAGRLILAEPAPGVRARLSARFGGNPRIAVMSTEDTANLPEHSNDLIVMHSVAQYLSGIELDEALKKIRRLIKPTGLFILGDVLAPGTPASTDALALLRFGLNDGFFVPAFVSLVRTLFSPYWHLRTSIGLARYDEATMRARLAAAGFSATRAPRNIGHNQARMTFACRPI
jgi:SAM-dependent methyltransferase